MVNDKILSIVIPAYNMELLLPKCLDSLIIGGIDNVVFNQLEVFVINDGSTDRSSEIAHSYQEQYPTIFRVIDKENGNYGSCVNRGLKEANGKYIKILDADDYLETSVLAKVISCLKTIDVDLVLTNYQTIDSHGDITGSFGFNLPKSTITEAGQLCNLGPYMAMHAVIYRTSNLRKIGYQQTEGISYTDQEWIFSPIQTVKTFYYLDENLYMYLVGRDGQTMDIKALAKNMHHNIEVLKRNIAVYNSIDQTLPTYRYLCGKLYSLAEFVYTQYLFHTDTMDVTPLIAFDKELKNLCPELYAYASSLKGGKLPFVKVWRWIYYKNDHGLNNFFAYRKYRMGARANQPLTPCAN